MPYLMMKVLTIHYLTTTLVSNSWAQYFSIEKHISYGAMEQFNIFSMDVSNTVMMPITAALDDDDDIETSGEGIMARSCKYLHSAVCIMQKGGH